MPDGLSNRVNTILAALRISATDLALLRSFNGLMDYHPASGVPAVIHRVSVPNLSILFRYVLLARALAVSIGDLISLITLTGVVPNSAHDLFANPSATLAFVKRVRQFLASAFSVAQLNYLYRDLYDPNSGMAPLPANVTLLLTNLQSGLAKIASENELIADPKGDLLRRKLASLLGNSIAGTTLELVNGTAVYTAPLSAKISSKLWELPTQNR